MPHETDKLASCLERVADDHSGCFTQEDAEVVAAAINALHTPEQPVSQQLVERVEWGDPDVQLVYRLLTDDGAPSDPADHWEGWVARRIIAAIRPAILEEAAQKVEDEAHEYGKVVYWLANAIRTLNRGDDMADSGSARG